MWVLFLLLVVPATAFSSSYFLYNQSPKANAVGLAAVAMEGPEASYYNPSLMKDGFEAGFTVYVPHLEFRYAGFEEDSRTPVSVTPFVYAAGSFGELRLGLAFNSPYGLLTKWSDDWPGAFLSTRGSLKTFFFHFSASRDFGFFSLGVSPFVVSASSEMRQVAPGGVRFKLHGKGKNIGFKVGASLKGRRWVLGCVYQSTVTLKMRGGAYLNGVRLSDAATRIKLPGYMAFGFSISPFRGVSFYGSFLRMFWGEVDTIKASIPGVPAMEVLKKGEDTNLISFGLSVDMGPLTVSGGVAFDESPFPEELSDPLLPDNDRVLYTFGLSYRNLSVAYQRTVFHRANASYPIKGTYKMAADVFLLSFRLEM